MAKRAGLQRCIFEATTVGPSVPWKGYDRGPCQRPTEEGSAEVLSRRGRLWGKTVGPPQGPRNRGGFWVKPCLPPGHGV